MARQTSGVQACHHSLSDHRKSFSFTKANPCHHRGERWLCCAPALGGESVNLSFNMGKLIWKFIKLHCPLLPVSGPCPRG